MKLETQSQKKYKRIFTIEDQITFGKLSGDYNPMHVDEHEARRFMFGGPVVPGIHTLFWGLEQWLESHANRIQINHINVKFLKPIRINEPATCVHEKSNDGMEIIKILTGASTATTIKFTFSDSTFEETDTSSDSVHFSSTPRALTLNDFKDLSGELELVFDQTVLNKIYPKISEKLPAYQIAHFLAFTRLVGMQCPGLHSLFAGMNVTFNEQAADQKLLHYRVRQFNRHSVLIDIHSNRMTGTLNTFIRPAPTEQKSVKSLMEIIKPDEFKGQRALLIGGSRGIGEVTAKLLAAGGADVRLTYYRGRKEAQKIVDEVIAENKQADCVAFNVLQPKDGLTQIKQSGWSPTHLYYFATPPIFCAEKDAFSQEILERFNRYYVIGFYHVVKELMQRYPDFATIFYPSTVAIDELPENMAEYCASKMAGETLCDYLKVQNPQLVISKPRLPRTATDQTASIFPAKNGDPIEVMLKHIRQLR